MLRKGKVKYIYDGDTIKIKTNYEFKKLRLAFIDTPEIGQPFYQEAKETLQKLLPLNAEIEYKLIAMDIYNRTVAEIYYQNEFINEIMIEKGLALVYPFMFNPHQSKMMAKQWKAKEQKIDLWYQKFPLPPWKFRKQKQIS